MVRTTKERLGWNDATPSAKIKVREFANAIVSLAHDRTRPLVPA
jgi:hypothetical protein